MAQGLTGPELAAAIRGLGDTGEFRSRRADLASLATAVETGVGLDGWAEVDLFTAFPVLSPPPTPATGPGGSPKADRRGERGRVPWSRFRAVLGGLPSVLVFLPIVLTWFGLHRASAAYLDLRSHDAEAASRDSFLGLWQTGFDHRLAAPLTFGWLTLYTALAVGALILTIIWNGWLRRQDAMAETEQRRTDLADRAAAEAVLAGRATVARSVLTRAQVFLGEHRSATPGRFTAELARSATMIRTLTEKVIAAQEGAVVVADRSGDMAKQLTAASEALTSSLAVLTTATGTLETTGVGVDAAVRKLHEGSAALERSVSGHLSTVTLRLQQTAERSEAGIAGISAASRELVTTARSELERSLGAMAAQIGAATGGLTAAAERLSRDLTEASTTAATTVGDTYHRAVGAAAVALAQEMARIGVDLTRAVTEVREITRDHITAMAQADADRRAPAAAGEGRCPAFATVGTDREEA